MPEVVLEIPARPEFLALTRQVVAAAVSLADTVSADRLDDLRVAVSEATTNAVEAHAQVGSADRIVVRCDLASDRVEVEVVDQGGGFDPGSVGQAPAAEDEDRLAWEHGLGLSIMRELTDETRIVPTPDGTAVHLVVYARPPARAGEDEADREGREDG